MVERRVRITNHLGLHARAAAKLVRLAAQFSSSITLRHGDAIADAASILDLLTLSAGFGANVDIAVVGPDEVAALDEVEQLVRDGFGEL
ncbi:MAG: HPr family phosphocarrier protein [Acidobacteriota bacterium]